MTTKMYVPQIVIAGETDVGVCAFGVYSTLELALVEVTKIVTAFNQQLDMAAAAEDAEEEVANFNVQDEYWILPEEVSPDEVYDFQGNSGDLDDGGNVWWIGEWTLDQSQHDVVVGLDMVTEGNA